MCAGVRVGENTRRGRLGPSNAHISINNGRIISIGPAIESLSSNQKAANGWFVDPINSVGAIPSYVKRGTKFVLLAACA